VRAPVLAVPVLVLVVAVNENNIAMNTETLFSGLFQSFPSPPKPGLYSYQKDDTGKVRLHLRVDPDGSGFLLVNASRIYYYNQTAAYIAYLFLQDFQCDQASKALSKHYKVSLKQAKLDCVDFYNQISLVTNPNFENLAKEHINCSDCDDQPSLSGMETEIALPFSHKLMAPYRMDLALTYRCNNDCAHCYNARPRNYQEMSTDSWKQILDKLWKLAIPHIIFTGGEPTLREDLPQLIHYAESLGQITGINTNGRLLKDLKYVDSLVEAGLDHLQITFESSSAEIHDAMVRMPGAWQDTTSGIRNVLKSGLFVMTNTTLLNANRDSLIDTLNFLADLGVSTVGLNALIYSGNGLTVGSGLKESELPDLLGIAKEITQKNDQKLIWYTPTQYCHFDPVFFDPSSGSGLNVKGCTAALYNMCIEPDGNVIPCQSYYESLGNILEAPWDSIWNHKLALRLRERKFIPLPCETCGLLAVCGGGCPLAAQAGHMASPKAIQFFEA